MKSLKTFMENALGGGPTNTVGSGAIAGVGQPPGSKSGEAPGPASTLFKKQLRRKPVVKEEHDNSLQLAEELFANCREVSTKTHFIHLITTSYAQHVALNEFYTGIIELADKFAENYIGKYEKFTIYPKVEYLSNDAIEVIEQFKNWISTNRHSISDDSELQNIIDSILELTNSTLYKLKELS